MPIESLKPDKKQSRAERGAEPKRVELPRDVKLLRNSDERTTVSMCYQRIDTLSSRLDGLERSWRSLRQTGMASGEIAEGEHNQEIQRIKGEIRAELQKGLPALKVWGEQVREFDRRAEELGSTEREGGYYQTRSEAIRRAAERVGLPLDLEDEKE